MTKEHKVRELAGMIMDADLPKRLQEEIERLQKENKELTDVFDLRWKADMCAIKKWQEVTGKAFVWPDHVDLCVWLMEQLNK